MSSNARRIVVISIVFVISLAGALALLQMSKDSGSSDSKGSQRSVRPSSTIWSVGDRWTVKVRQDAGAITPDGDSSIAEVPFRFEVTGAPKRSGGTWTVTVHQDGAEGPFAAGWHLHYREQGGKMLLHTVAVGTEPPLEAQLATIVLGPQFPYETTYSAPPKSATIDAARLLKRSQLPPTTLPGSDGGDSGAAPPAAAPKLDIGGAPDTSPAPKP